MLIFQAGMAESADALASGASGGNLVEVQVFLPAPYRIKLVLLKGYEFFCFSIEIVNFL